MSRRIRDHARGNVVAYVALFFAISLGTAWALGEDSVKSKHIKDGQVRTADVADDTGPHALQGNDVANGALSGADIAPGSIDGGEVAPDGLTGADIDESTLGKVGDADTVDTVDSSAFTIGRSTTVGGSNCDPSSLTFVECAEVEITMPRSGKLFVIATGTTFGLGGAYQGDCMITIDGNGIGTLTSYGEGNTDPTHDAFNRGDGFALQAITSTLASGSHTAALECGESDADFIARNMAISALMIGTA